MTWFKSNGVYHNARGVCGQWLGNICTDRVEYNLIVGCHTSTKRRLGWVVPSWSLLLIWHDKDRKRPVLARHISFCIIVIKMVIYGDLMATNGRQKQTKKFYFHREKSFQWHSNIHSFTQWHVGILQCIWRFYMVNSNILTPCDFG